MAESVVVHFAIADWDTTVAQLLEMGCEMTEPRTCCLPPLLVIYPYEDLNSEYEPANVVRLLALLKRQPSSSIAIEMRRSAGPQAVDAAASLCARLLERYEAIVDDTYSEMWSHDDITRGARKRDGGFLDCYRHPAGAG